MFQGGSYVVTGLKRFVKALLLIPETCNQVQCLWEMFIPFLSQIASINFATAICIDRLFAVSFPSTYKFVHSAYIISLNSAAWTYSLILGGFYFYKSSYSLILANCNLAGIMMQSFYDFQSIQSLVLSVFTTLIYAVVLLLLKVKLMRAKKQHKNMAETRKILDRATTMTLSTVMFAFLVTQVGSTICLTAIADLETSKKNTLSPIIRVLPVFNSGINFWIYLWRSSEFRSAFYILTGLKARSIQPQSTANSHHFNHPSTLPISVLPMSAWHSKA